MSVSTKAIIQRMQAELTKANEVSQMNEAQMKKHLAKVHVLCELLLDSDREKDQEREVINKLEENKVKPTNDFTLGDGNGDSIFDF